MVIAAEKPLLGMDMLHRCRILMVFAMFLSVIVPVHPVSISLYGRIDNMSSLMNRSFAYLHCILWGGIAIRLNS